jgi:SAM-dependent methyltransferase
MPALARAVVLAGRIRRRIARTQPSEAGDIRLVREYAPGRSFVDVGCMWNIHGAIAFAAEEAGATAVTGVDVMAATPEYQAEHTRRESKMRFLCGDLHDPSTIEAVGVHDVVWCAGVLYHAAHPVLMLQRLRELTGELLILSTATLPEFPGVRGACILYPALDDRERRDYLPAGSGERLAITSPFDHNQWYGNWWWGITPSALRGLLRVAGFEVVEVSNGSFRRTAVCRPMG